MYNRGDIVLVHYPFSDNDTLKKRPALIISNNIVNSFGELILVQITSKTKISGLFIEINETDVVYKMPLKSFIRPNKIFTLNSQLVLNKVNISNQSLLNKVIENIKASIS